MNLASDPHLAAPAGADEYAGHSRCYACYGCSDCAEYLICARGGPDEVDAMVEKYAGRPGYGRRIFHWACVEGNLHAAKRLAEAFAISAEAVALYAHSDLRGALARGNLELVEWLVATYGITRGELAALRPLLAEMASYPARSRDWLRSFGVDPAAGRAL